MPKRKSPAHDKIRSIVAFNLQRMLDEKNIGMHAAAKKASVDRSGLYAIKNGSCSANVDTLAKLADALDFEIEEFFVEPEEDDDEDVA